jgi:hypothetical protein
MEKKVNFIIPACIILSILYIFLAIRPLGSELQFIPQWTIHTIRASETKSSAPLIPFRLGQTIGYFTSDGTVSSVISFPYKATISKSAYALFGTDDNQIPFYDTNGSETGAITKNGFPFFTDEHLYLFLPGGSSFSELNETGTVTWTYEGYAPVTAFASSHAATAAGFSDGSIIVFSPDGSSSDTFSPGGSDYPVILGVGVSKTATYLACVSGQEKQRFVLAKKADNQYTAVYHKYLDQSLTGQVLVQFSNDEKTVWYSFSGGLGIVNIKTGKHTHIPIDGKILMIKESLKTGFVFILSKKDATFTVSTLEPFDSIAGSFSFEAKNAFIDVNDNSLFVGRDSSITRIDVIQH